METRAPYALVGLFVLAIIAAVFGFVYWLHNSSGLTERTVYRVRFENTVSGLLKGAAVLFNGMRVGEVTDLRLDADSPRLVMATIAIDRGTPVRADTKVGLDFQGLTGVPVVTLQGGTTPLPAGQKSPQEPYVLVADPAAGQSMTNAARDALRRLDGILGDNADALKSTIDNLKTFSETLARNSDRLDVIIGGLERLVGGGSANANQIIYDLTAPTQFSRIDKTPRGQLTVLEPATPIMLDTRKILVRPNGSEDSTFAKAQWSDNVPKLLQAKVIQAFENAGLSRNVSRPTDASAPDKQLAIDVRKFQILISPQPTAEIEFAARIFSGDGRIVEAKVFRAAVPISEMNASGGTAALDQAFGKATTELVEWAAGVI